MTSKPHPMRDHKSSPSNLGYSFDLSKFKNPVLEQVLVSEDIARTYKSLKIYPYSSSGTYNLDNLLKFFNRMHGMSSTLGACRSSIRSYAFRGKIGVYLEQDSDFDIEDSVEIDVDLKKKFKEDVLSKVTYSKKSVKSFQEAIYESLFDNGNVFVEVVLSRTGEQRNAKFIYHNTETCKIIEGDDGKDYCIISKKFTTAHMSKYPPRIIDLGPDFTDEGDGVYRCMVHHKIGNSGKYGRPIWLAAWLHGYRESQDVDLIIKLANKFFTGHVILEYEGDDDEVTQFEGEEGDEGRQPKSLGQKIEENFTAGAKDPKTVLAMERPKGTSPFKSEQIQPNTNESFYDSEDKKNRRKLFENLDWSESLLGNMGGSFSSDSFESELRNKDKGILDFFRGLCADVLNECYGYVDEFCNNGFYSAVKVRSNSLFSANDMSAKDAKDFVSNITEVAKAGIVTITPDIEAKVRVLLRLPDMSPEVVSYWEGIGGAKVVQSSSSGKEKQVDE